MNKEDNLERRVRVVSVNRYLQCDGSYNYYQQNPKCYYKDNKLISEVYCDYLKQDRCIIPLNEISSVDILYTKEMFYTVPELK